MTLKILIVGGGIAGLATAVALRKARHEVIVLEKSQAKREDGIAVSTPPNCTRVLKSWNFDFVKARMVKCAGLDMIKADISPTMIFPRNHDQDVYGAPFMCAHRVDLHEAFREMATGMHASQAASVEVRGGCNVVSYDEEQPAALSKLSSLRFVVPTERLVEQPSLVAHRFGEQRTGVSKYGSSNKIGLFRSPCRDNTLQNFGVFHSYHEASQACPRGGIARVNPAGNLPLTVRERLSRRC